MGHETVSATFNMKQNTDRTEDGCRIEVTFLWNKTTSRTYNLLSPSRQQLLCTSTLARFKWISEMCGIFVGFHSEVNRVQKKVYIFFHASQLSREQVEASLPDSSLWSESKGKKQLWTHSVQSSRELGMLKLIDFHRFKHIYPCWIVCIQCGAYIATNNVRNCRLSIAYWWPIMSLFILW